MVTRASPINTAPRTVCWAESAVVPSLFPLQKKISVKVTHYCGRQGGRRRRIRLARGIGQQTHLIVSSLPDESKSQLPFTNDAPGKKWVNNFYRRRNKIFTLTYPRY